MTNETDIDSNDILRIMVSTDNHLGYGEKDAVRCKFIKTSRDGVTLLFTSRPNCTPPTPCVIKYVYFFIYLFLI